MIPVTNFGIGGQVLAHTTVRTKEEAFAFLGSVDARGNPKLINKAVAERPAHRFNDAYDDRNEATSVDPSEVGNTRGAQGD
jgi:hypothetical protein